MHVFILINIHDIMIATAVFEQVLLKKEKGVCFFYFGAEDISHQYFSIHKKINYCTNGMIGKILLFRKIENILKRDSYVYASSYINFVSNVFFRKKTINKVLLSHGLVNYYNNDSNTWQKRDKFKQAILSIIAGKLYDPYFKHITNYEKINYNRGYFFSNRNLVTKTQDDVELNFPSFNFKLPDEPYAIYLDQDTKFLKSEKLSLSLRKRLLDKVSSLPVNVVLYKPHPSMTRPTPGDLGADKKIIYIDKNIPAEMLFSNLNNKYAISYLSTSLIYNKIINERSLSIAVSFQENVDDYSFSNQHKEITTLLEKFDVNINQLRVGEVYE